MRLTIRRIAALLPATAMYAVGHLAVYSTFGNSVAAAARLARDRIPDFSDSDVGLLRGLLYWSLIYSILTLPSLAALVPAYGIYELLRRASTRQPGCFSVGAATVTATAFWLSHVVACLSVLWVNWPQVISDGALESLAALFPYLPPNIWFRIRAMVVPMTLFTFWLTVYALWTAKPSADSEPRCRKCGYILRGLADRRCPECFTPFDMSAPDDKPCSHSPASPPANTHDQ